MYARACDHIALPLRVCVCVCVNAFLLKNFPAHFSRWVTNFHNFSSLVAQLNQFSCLQNILLTKNEMEKLVDFHTHTHTHTHRHGHTRSRTVPVLFRTKWTTRAAGPSGPGLTWAGATLLGRRNNYLPALLGVAFPPVARRRSPHTHTYTHGERSAKFRTCPRWVRYVFATATRPPGAPPPSDARKTEPAASATLFHRPIYPPLGPVLNSLFLECCSCCCCCVCTARNERTNDTNLLPLPLLLLLQHLVDPPRKRSNVCARLFRVFFPPPRPLLQTAPFPRRALRSVRSS